VQNQVWDASLYDRAHGFVAAFGADLLELLDARPGERILDIGCGTGDHVAALRQRGVAAHGIDSSDEMVQHARIKHPGVPVSVADARRLDAGADLDAVFSNAALHWIPEAGEVATAVAGALRPGGRFVAELGGSGNVAAIVEAAAAVRAERGLLPAASPWYFPTVGQYATVLEAAGFEVRRAWLFDRPTRLDGEQGLSTWVRMFGAHLLDGVADPDAFLAGLSVRAKDRLWRNNAWWADYRRLRIAALKPASP
jgi:trans-aconitate methyltransferase